MEVEGGTSWRGSQALPLGFIFLRVVALFVLYCNLLGISYHLKIFVLLVPYEWAKQLKQFKRVSFVLSLGLMTQHHI